MTIRLLDAEMVRFLRSETAEVICVRGRWGVGKTYAWRRYLDAALKEKRLKGVENYAYVSLFGLNSLNELRFAVFEGTVNADRFRSGPDVQSFDAILGKALDAMRKSRPFFDTFAGLFGRKDAGEALARASFLLVRKQLVCFDDLERAGDGLKQRDVLGLTSFLKEQRNCKVVLLLNDAEMDGGEKTEFDRQLEKVVDVSLRFDPTPQEAAEIAFGGGDPMAARLRPLVERLGIVNIRIMKKAERSARVVEHMLEGRPEAVREQATQTVVLATCSILQPGILPPLTFLRNYNSLSIAMRSHRQPLSDIEEGWARTLREYGFENADTLDNAILDGAERGAFDGAAIQDAGRGLEKVIAQNGRTDTFSEAWDRFHGDLQASDDDILGGLHRGALENLSRITTLNLNATVRLLRGQGKSNWADELVAAYIKAHSADRDVLDLTRDPIMSSEPLDPDLATAFAAALSGIVDDRDPVEVFDAAMERGGWDREDERLLTALSSSDWLRLFETRRGKRVAASIEFARMLGRLESAEGRAIGEAVEGALRVIADKSPLLALRMRRFGIFA